METNCEHPVSVLFVHKGLLLCAGCYLCVRDPFSDEKPEAMDVNPQTTQDND